LGYWAFFRGEQCEMAHAGKGNILIGVVALLAVLIQVQSCSRKDRPEPGEDKDRAAMSEAVSRERAESAAKLEKVEAERCISDLPSLTANYEALMRKKEFRSAATLLERCAVLTRAPAVINAFQAADAADDQQTAQDPKREVRERLWAFERLQRLYPERYAKLETLHGRLIQADARRLAAEKRKEGVVLGMTKDEVRASSWGRPRDINRTTNRFGTTEQWVYDGGYLYFTDGVLTSIQN
jgi:hypothetical protein